MIKKNDVIKILKTVPDPELGISIYDLGLIYNVVVAEKGRVDITMTLTSPGCPLIDMIEKDIKKNVKKLKGVTSVHIDITFDPPWSVDKMTKKGKKMMGIE